MRRRFRINEEIRVPEVMIVTETGKEVLPVAQAMERARAAGLDLVEVAPQAKPPVCKILDVGSYLYKLEKEERKQRRSQHHTEVKTIRIGFRTDTHDLDRQAERTREFLMERHLVKVDLVMRGREFTNQQFARDKLTRFIQTLLDVGEVEQTMKKQGDRYYVILKPKKK